MGGAIMAARDMPGSDLAPKVAFAPLPHLADQPPRQRLRWAALCSVALHLTLVGGWAVLAAPVRPLNVADLETAQVELISQERFMALSAPQPEIAAAPIAPPAQPIEMAALAEPLPTMVVEDPAPALAPPEAVPPLPETQPDALPDVAADLPSEPAKPAKPTPKAPAPKAAAKKAKKASQPSAAQAASAAAPSSKGQAEALKVDWGSKVRARINRKIGRSDGAGTVKLRLTLAPTGALLSVKVVGSAGPALDAAALKAVKAAAPFPRAPKGLAEASYSFSLPITFAG